MATRKRQAEIGDRSVAAGQSHPTANLQRELFAGAKVKYPKRDFYLSAVVCEGVSHPPDLNQLAARHAKQQRPGYNSYVRALAVDGIPLTPGAEMLYLAARMEHIFGKALDPSRENELRARMVELLHADDWLCDERLIYQIAGDEVGEMPDHLCLIQCGLIGPGLEALADRPAIRRVLAAVALPNAFEREELDADQTVFAARHADLKLAVESLLDASSDYPASMRCGLASDATADKMFITLLERMVAGVASGELKRKLVAPFTSLDAVAAHIECFFRSRSNDLAFLESRLRLLMALEGVAPCEDDVCGLPRARFWEVLVNACSLQRMPSVLSREQTVDTLAPHAWRQLMELAVTTGAGELSCSIGGAYDMTFADGLERFAGRSASQVYAALERHRVMEGCIRAGQSVSAAANAPARRRSMGI
jgi:hypothetical protein